MLEYRPALKLRETQYLRDRFFPPSVEQTIRPVHNKPWRESIECECECWRGCMQEGAGLQARGHGRWKNPQRCTTMVQRIVLTGVEASLHARAATSRSMQLAEPNWAARSIAVYPSYAEHGHHKNVIH